MLKNDYKLKLSWNSVYSCFNIKITGDRACTFKDIYYLELVDLEDPNSSNRLGVEIFPKDPKYYTCPHTVVVSITK